MNPSTIRPTAVLVISLLLVSQVAFGMQSSMRMQHLGVRDGLSHGAVKAIAQDQSGFIWIGASNGLNRFDGLEIISYRADEREHTLDNDYIRDLYVARDASLWIATGSGLSRFDSATGQFENFPLPKREGGENTLAYKISEDSDGNLWVATAGLGLAHFNRDTQTYQLYRHDPQRPESTPSSDFLYTVVADEQQRLWLGSRDAGLDLFVPGQGRIKNWRHHADQEHSLSHNTVYSVLIDSHGTVWAGTRGGGVNRLRDDQSGFEHFRHDPSDKTSLSGDRVWGILEDDQGAYWVATETGVSRMTNHQTGAFESLHHDPLDDSTLPTNAVNAIFEDAEGLIWFGTFGSGVSRVDPDTARFGLVRNDPTDPDSLPTNHILSLHAGSDALWLGTTEGLVRHDRENDSYLSYRYTPGNPNSISDNLIRTIHPAKQGNLLWLGTQNAGLNLFDPTTGNNQRFLQKPSAPGQPIRGQEGIMALATTADGTLWIGSRDGLLARHPQTGTFREYTHDPEDDASLPANRVLDLLVDHRDRLWIGTTAGVARLDNTANGEFRRYQHDPGSGNGLSSNTVSVLHQSRDERIWVGTFGGGLNVLEPQTDIIKPVPSAGGMEASSIQSLQEDDRGMLWLGTATGLYRLDPDHYSALRFTEADGLQATHFEHNAAARGADGHLYFAGVEGYNGFDPDSIPVSSQPPRSVVTNVRLFDGKHIANLASGSGASSTGLPPKQVTLDANQRVFSIRFVALNYAAPLESRFRYRMDGLDSDWRYTDASRNTVTWSYLPTGSYQFQVQAASQHGEWGEPAVLDINKRPPIWLSIPAFVGYALLLIAVASSLIIRNRQNKAAERRHRVELKREVRNRTRKLRQRNRQLQLAQNQLMTQEKMASLGSLVAGVSHEINTPLGIGVTAASQLQNALRRFRRQREENQLRLRDLTAFEATIDEGSDIILRNLRRATELMRSFKQVAVDQTGEQYRQFNLAQYLNETLAALGPKIRQSRATVSTECPADIQMSGYPGAIYQIIANLIVNSLVHGFEPLTDDRERRIELSARMLANDRVELNYRDNGQGMDQTTLRKVFDPFFTTRLGEGGSGLGMHIVYNLCTQLLQGSIEIDSQPDAGIHVTMILPHVLDAGQGKT